MSISAPEARQIPLPFAPAATPDDLFLRVFRRLGMKRPAPSFRVVYRPFANLRSSIQLRGDCAAVHLSDLLEGAPAIVTEALAEILVAQLFHRRPSREARECYLAYVMKPEVRRRIDEARGRRGRKRLLPAKGRHYDLEEIFDKLNRRFFRGELICRRIGWSPARSRSVLGHYDSAHGTIIISRALDSAKVPCRVIEYLVFHEMLHILHPVGRNGHRRVVHSREFRDAEKRFPNYEQVRRELKSACP
ncbi:MAG: M48 family metallopeptidase [Terriglobia bacterium]